MGRVEIQWCRRRYININMATGLGNAAVCLGALMTSAAWTGRLNGSVDSGSHGNPEASVWVSQGV